MTKRTARAFLLQDYLLTIGDDEYSDAVSSAELAATTPTSTFKSINGKAQNLSGKASFVLNVTFAQDWAADSLANLLYDHEGEERTFTLEPQGEDGPVFAGRLVLAIGGVGGAADATATSTAAFQVIGKPTKTLPVAGAQVASVEADEPDTV